MDSQPAMLETATGSGSSTSSDSIINISRSGASSISTSASSPTTVDELHSEIDSLREEKKLLEGRIRGYKTLRKFLFVSFFVC